MSPVKRAVSAAAARTARPCDNCACKRARWYCAADDAFLCQACDGSVHSANPLARRHERLSLKATCAPLHLDAEPLWLHGCRRKARTPRGGKPGAGKPAEPSPPQLLVPDLSSSDNLSPSNVNDEHLLCRVPTFDPVDDVIITARDKDKPSAQAAAAMAAEVNFMSGEAACDADMAADVERLLGDDELLCMDALGLLECTGEEMEWKVKMEDVDEAGLDGGHADAEVDFTCDTLDLKFGIEESPLTSAMRRLGSEEGEEVIKEEMMNSKKKKKMCLRLDYEAVMTAWASHGSPWTTGDRQDLNPDDCWSEWTGMACGWEEQQQWMMGDRGREAKVSRYREKRRSRLFSKKIRYEVRKLNAEKRPRMKGRFVKRASMPGVPSF